MNITFILGNGFDIQLGLNSRYRDFLKEYVKPLPEDNKNIRLFKEYLSQSENQELWSDAEIAMGQHLGEFSDKTLGEYVERIRNFEVSMFGYLVKEQKRCSFIKGDKIGQIFRDFLNDFPKDCLNRRSSELNIGSVNEHVTYHFITFNYTNLLDRLVKCSGISEETFSVRKFGNVSYWDKKGKIYHVHGDLNTQIIMGVNDESQLDLKGGVTPGPRLFRKLIKPQINQASRHVWDLPGLRLIEKSDLIAIYGVSYGATDSLWWRAVRDWLDGNNSHKVIIFMRDTGRQFDKMIPWDEIDYEEDKRKEALHQLGFEEGHPHFEQLMERVYIVMNTKRLNLKELLLGKAGPEEPPEAIAAAAGSEAGAGAV